MLLAAVVTAAALAGCGQLFAQHQNTATLTSLSNRVDSLDAQVGELQAALASGAGTSGGSTQQNESRGVVSATLPVATVEANVLNVRSDPDLTGTVRGQLLQNARVNVLAIQGNWSEIRFTNPVTGLTLTGWVDSTYLGPSTVPGASATGSAQSSTSGSGTAANASAGSASSVSGTMISSSISAS